MWSSACRIPAWTRRMGYARQSGIPYGIGFIKNRYIGRTFIQPTQSRARERGAHQAQPPSQSIGGGQARGPGGRFHRARHHLRAHRAACCARRARRKCTCASPPRRSCIPAISAPMSTSEDKLIACRMNHDVQDMAKESSAWIPSAISSVDDARKIAVGCRCELLRRRASRANIPSKLPSRRAHDKYRQIRRIGCHLPKE